MIEKQIGLPNRLASNFNFPTGPRIKLYDPSRIEEWVKNNPAQVEPVRLRRLEKPLKYKTYQERVAEKKMLSEQVKLSEQATSTSKRSRRVQAYSQQRKFVRGLFQRIFQK